MKKAFTIIELIITMVILSIVSYIASGLIAKTYIGYNQTNALHKANLKLEIALNSIANRLEYAIADTIVKRKSATDASIELIYQAPNDYTVLEWVGYDKDGFDANNLVSGGTAGAATDKPAWSGFCSLKASNKYYMITPGSDLRFAFEIINRLSNTKANFVRKSSVAIFFPGNYDYKNIGYSNIPFDTSGLALIKGYNSSSNRLSFSTPIKRVTEHYKLAWSAYAVLPTNCRANSGCDLMLRYNFRPWQKNDYNSVDAVKNQKLLATNVTVFKTYATQNRIHIKLCVKERFGVNKIASICKEKVVFK